MFVQQIIAFNAMEMASMLPFLSTHCSVCFSAEGSAVWTRVFCKVTLEMKGLRRFVGLGALILEILLGLYLAPSGPLLAVACVGRWRAISERTAHVGNQRAFAQSMS